MEIQLGHPRRQRICTGASVVKHGKGFTLIELLIMVLSAAITAAAVIPRLLSMADDAATSAGSSILSALETANSLTFSRQLARGITGPYTMGDILSNVDIKGVESSEVTLSSSSAGHVKHFLSNLLRVCCCGGLRLFIPFI